MFERFTRDARAVVVSTQDLCRSLGADEVRPVHLLLALTEEGSGARDVARRPRPHRGCRERRPWVPRGRPRRRRWVTTTQRRCARSASTSTPSARRWTSSSARAPSRGPRPPPRATGRDDEADATTTRPTSARRRFGLGGHVRFGRGAKKVLELVAARGDPRSTPARSAASTSPWRCCAPTTRPSGCCSARSASTSGPCAPTSRAAAGAAPDVVSDPGSPRRGGGRHPTS